MQEPNFPYESDEYQEDNDSLTGACNCHDSFMCPDDNPTLDVEYGQF